MNWLSYILAGAIIGWLVEFLIDYFFWRRKRICTAGERRLSNSVNGLLEENANYRKSIVELSRRDELATNLEAELESRKAELASLEARLKERDTELLDLWGQVGRFGDIEASVEDLEASIADRDAEIVNLQAKLAEFDGLQASLNSRNAEIAALRKQLDDNLNSKVDGPTSRQSEANINLNTQALLAEKNAEIARLTTLLETAAMVEANPEAENIVSALPPAPASIPAPAKRKDNLTKIWGISPKISRLLKEAGIHSFRQLADTDVHRLSQILDEAGPSYQLFDTERYQTWPEQAAYAAAGDWDRLASYRERYQAEQFQATDNLQRIWSIGQQAEALLLGRGIITFALLAHTEQATIDDILDTIAPRFQFSKQELYEAWVQQAQLINEGKRRSLKELQDQYRAKHNWDNLQKIWGIGPKTANVLRAHGLSTFNQLAEANATAIDELLIEAAVQIPDASVDLYQSWIEQAQFAANGAWDSFDDLQDQFRVKYGQQEDDLQQIWGINPETAALLHQQNIHTFDDLIEAEETLLQEILAQTSTSFDLSPQTLYETWVSQAKLAASNDWEGLELLQTQISPTS